MSVGYIILYDCSGNKIVTANTRFIGTVIYKEA